MMRGDVAALSALARRKAKREMGKNDPRPSRRRLRRLLRMRGLEDFTLAGSCSSPHAEAAAKRPSKDERGLRFDVQNGLDGFRGRGVGSESDGCRRLARERLAG